MKEIKFSNHANVKLLILKKHGIIINEDFVKEVIIFSNKVEKGWHNKERMVA